MTKQNIIYLFILHMIWTLADYYSKMFGIDPYESPQDIPCDIFEEEGKTVLRFSFPYIAINNPSSTTDMAEIMEDHLQCCLLPQQTVLELYQGGTEWFELVEPLHVMAVRRSKDKYEIDIIYVDNSVAFQYVKTKYGLLNVVR